MSPPKPKSTFQVTSLGPEYVPEYMALHKNLPQDEQRFVRPRTDFDLNLHLSAPMPLIGVHQSYPGHAHPMLVAAALLTYPQYAEDSRYLKGYPLHDTTAVLQGVISRRKGAASLIIDAARDLAAMEGHTSLIAKVHGENERAQRSFLRNGFKLSSERKDAFSKHPVLFFTTQVGWGAEVTSSPSSAAQPSEEPQRALDPPAYRSRKEELPEGNLQAHM